MKYKIGQIVEGTVSGLQPYGAFVRLDKDNQGLIHISEYKHGYVSSIEEMLSVGDEVRVQVLDIDEYSGRVSLSKRSLEKPEGDLEQDSKRKKHFWTDYKEKIGYKSIEKHKSSWVNEAMKKIGK